LFLGATVHYWTVVTLDLVEYQVEIELTRVALIASL